MTSESDARQYVAGPSCVAPSEAGGQSQADWPRLKRLSERFPLGPVQGSELSDSRNDLVDVEEDAWMPGTASYSDW
jgi:hypothetical protein